MPVAKKDAPTEPTDEGKGAVDPGSPKEPAKADKPKTVKARLVNPNRRVVFSPRGLVFESGVPNGPLTEDELAQLRATSGGLEFDVV